MAVTRETLRRLRRRHHQSVDNLRVLLLPLPLLSSLGAGAWKELALCYQLAQSRFRVLDPGRIVGGRFRELRSFPRVTELLQQPTNISLM